MGNDIILKSQKVKIRSQLRDYLKELSEKERLSFQTLFNIQLKILLNDLTKSLKKDHLVIGAYRAMAHEVSVDDFYSNMHEHTWLFPRVDTHDRRPDLLKMDSAKVEKPEQSPEQKPTQVLKNTMQFLEPKNMKDFQIGTFGIHEPLVDCNRVPIEEIDLFLIPGLGFDRVGTRLGQGKGYYDRALAESTALKVGVCFDGQILNENLPREDHDICMDFLVSNVEIYQRTRKGKMVKWK